MTARIGNFSSQVPTVGPAFWGAGPSMDPNLRSSIMGRLGPTQGDYEPPEDPRTALFPTPSAYGQMPSDGTIEPQGQDADFSGPAEKILANDKTPDESGDGLGLMDTLGIVNMGFGIGRQIYDATRPKPQRFRQTAPAGGRSNPFHKKF